MKNQMIDLRNHLFATLEGLTDKEDPMDLERAKAVTDVAQTLINTAKVEVDLVKAVGAQADSGFITSNRPQVPALGQSKPGGGIDGQANPTTQGPASRQG